MLLKIPTTGAIVACADNPTVVGLIDSLKADSENFPKVLWYGESNRSTLRLVSRKPWMYQQLPDKRFGQEIEYTLGEQAITIRTKLTGLHNALNIAACFYRIAYCCVNLAICFLYFVEVVDESCFAVDVERCTYF